MSQGDGGPRSGSRTARPILPVLLTALLLIGIGWNLLALGSGDLPLYLKRIWRNRERLAVDRSAALFLGSVGASYVQFLHDNLPSDATVVLAPGYPTGHEGIMEYFLLPRNVHDCDAPFEQCARRYAGPQTYVLATRGAALPEPEVLGYQFVAFDEANWEFQGFYAPIGGAVIAQPLEPVGATQLVREIALGLGLVLLLGLIGISVASALAGAGRPWMTLAAAFPLGAALVTFSLFVASWVGVRLDAVLLLVVLGGWVGVAVLACRRSLRAWAAAARAAPPAAGIQRARRLTVLVAALLGLVGLSVVLAVGLSYYEDDELAIWSIKGYGMVLAGSVWAGADWGAHGLSYPLNVPLLIGAFRLATGDLLPVSKLAFPLFYASLLLGIGDFWRRHGLGRNAAALALLFVATIPLIQFHSTLGLANLPLAVYLVLGVLVAVDGYESRSLGTTALGGLLLAAGAWTRAEAMIYAATLLIALLVLGGAYAREQKVLLAALILPTIIGTGTWLAFALPSVLASHLGTAVDAFGQSVNSASVGVAPLGTLFAAFARTALHKERWAALLPVLGVLLIVAVLRRREAGQRAAGWLLLAGALLTIEVVSIFFIRSYSRVDFDILVGRAIHRHLIPAFLLLLVGACIAALRRPPAANPPAGTLAGATGDASVGDS